MKIRIELTPREALSLFSLADNSAQDIEDFFMGNKREIKAGNNAIEKLVTAIPLRIWEKEKTLSEKSCVKLSKLCNPQK